MELALLTGHRWGVSSKRPERFKIYHLIESGKEYLIKNSWVTQNVVGKYDNNFLERWGCIILNEEDLEL